MTFNSLTFIVFFAIIMGLHYLPIFSWRTKKINLLLASYLFYVAWNPPFVILLWLSTVVDFFVGKRLGAEQRPNRRKMLVLVSLALNLGLLAYFKYGSFLLENFVTLLASLGVDYQPAQPDIILPVGISFYTFQTLSYTLDVYRRKFPPEKSLLDFALFVTFFPQLVAGPIVRPGILIPQFRVPHYATRDQFTWGLGLLTLGLFMKVVLADSLLSGPADFVFGFAAPLHPLDAWTGVLAFSGQIFCDFAGYSTCAIGVALCLGFTLPENFRYPYAAVGFSDFWRRWHISFSTWLRDYLYIPLGGNRKGISRTYVNLMLTMLLGGLWHGASWTFVVWGGLHGLYLILERLIQHRQKQPAPAAVFDQIVRQAAIVPSVPVGKRAALLGGALLTFFLINITWVFFRAPDFGTAGRLLAAMFGVIPVKVEVLSTLDLLRVYLVMIPLVMIHWRMRDTHVVTVAGRAPWWLLGCTWGAMLILILLAQESGDSFIYFQF